MAMEVLYSDLPTGMFVFAAQEPRCFGMSADIWIETSHLISFYRPVYESRYSVTRGLAILL